MSKGTNEQANLKRKNEEKEKKERRTKGKNRF